MNIALIGYGKMGQAIERIATERGHTVILKITSANKNEFTKDAIGKADVAIEFTHPEAAEDNVLHCLKAGVPVVCGTTGWNRTLPHAGLTAVKNGTAFLHASNFSIGVNIFFEINKRLAILMDEQGNYDVTVEETHHTQKKDAPSGTAITIAEQIIDNLDRKKHWVLNEAKKPEDLAIVAHREEQVPGTHIVKYTSPIDNIEISHTAHNRDGFALGAVLAAEFVAGRQGVYSMSDVLGLSNHF